MTLLRACGQPNGRPAATGAERGGRKVKVCHVIFSRRRCCTSLAMAPVLCAGSAARVALRCRAAPARCRAAPPRCACGALRVAQPGGADARFPRCQGAAATTRRCRVARPRVPRAAAGAYLPLRARAATCAPRLGAADASRARFAPPPATASPQQSRRRLRRRVRLHACAPSRRARASPISRTPPLPARASRALPRRTGFPLRQADRQHLRSRRVQEDGASPPHRTRHSALTRVSRACVPALTALPSFRPRRKTRPSRAACCTPSSRHAQTCMKRSCGHAAVRASLCARQR
jgi:hypothetical protein